MSDGQWDADDYKPPVFKTGIVSDKWEGEDEDDDVKDNWDDEDDAEQDQKKEPESSDGVKAVQIKKKGTLKNKLKEKEEQRNREKEEELRKKQEAVAATQVPSHEELFEEKLRRQKLQEEADLELAKEAFGANDLPKTGIDSIEPTNKEEFDTLQKALVDKLTKYEKSSLYLPFLDDLFRELCVNLEADDIKKLGSTLNAVSTEKAKVAKAGKTKKKAGSSKKASLVVGKASDFDYADYGGGDEYEDFM